MFVLSGEISAQIEIKGSKFIAFLEPCDDIRNIRIRQSQLKAQHPKAVHVVYAARAINEFDQVVEDFSDDGEPKGSSAAPMLNVLRGSDILGAAYVVRYFGGTLLGIGGLVRAYSKALNDAISAAKACNALKFYEKKQKYFLQVPYDLWRQVEYLCAEYEYSAEFCECVKAYLSLSSDEKLILESALLQKLPQLRLTPCS